MDLKKKLGQNTPKYLFVDTNCCEGKDQINAVSQADANDAMGSSQGSSNLPQLELPDSAGGSSLHYVKSLDVIDSIVSSLSLRATQLSNAMSNLAVGLDCL